MALLLLYSHHYISLHYKFDSVFHAFTSEECLIYIKEVLNVFKLDVDRFIIFYLINYSFCFVCIYKYI